MRGAFVGTVGALAIVAAIAGLSLDAFRMGPLERPLEPSVVQAGFSGSYMARGGSSLPFGLCPAPPCDAATEVDLSFTGLPSVPYEGVLTGTAGAVSLGPLTGEGADHILRWSSTDDHTDKTSIVLRFAGHDVASVPVRGTGAAERIGSTIVATWPPAAAVLGTHVHLNEIGGVTLSSVAVAHLPLVPPAGWTLHAWLEGPQGAVGFGGLDVGEEGTFLDGRLERLRLEDYDRFVVALSVTGTAVAAGEGFPVAFAVLHPAR